jgi:hypothetical protein
MVSFNYNKKVQLPLEKLRKIRDESHEQVEILRRQEQEKIYNQLGINRNWGWLPSFVEKGDDTKQEGYDISHFDFHGRFPSLKEAFKEDFDSAEADPPIDNEGEICRVHMIHISRIGKEANELILYNSRYGAAQNRSMNYQRKLTEMLLIIQGKLEKALTI